MFESALYNCSPCLELIGGQVRRMLRVMSVEMCFILPPSLFLSPSSPSLPTHCPE